MHETTSRERNREAQRRYRERHPERVRANWRAATKRYQAKPDFERNIEAELEAQRSRRLANSEPFRVAERVSKQRRQGIAVNALDQDTIDHIEAIAMGGTGDWTNLTAACASCNSRKHTKPLLEFLCR